jgi:hypothetical protein
MPYIEKKRREHFKQDEITAFVDGTTDIFTVGDINYIITNAVNQYVKLKGLSYSSINDVIGILECAKMEFYRRVAVPYEEKKKELNGDVY